MGRIAKKTSDEDWAATVVQSNDDVVLANDNIAQTNGYSSAAACATTDTIADSRIAYLWLDAGLSRHSFRGADTSAARLCGWVMAFFVCAWLAAVVAWTDSRMRPMEATEQMERLAENLANSTTIPTKTMSEVARLIGQPWYDCRHVSCSAQLEERNRAVRAKLSSLLAAKEMSNEFSASRKYGGASVEISR